MKLHRLCRPLALAVACLLPLAAAADESQDKLATCTAQTMDADRRIAACEWLLRKKSVPPSNLPNIYFSLAGGYDERGQYDRAIKIYSWLLERLPEQEQGSAMVRARRADSYRRQGNYDRAIADFDWLLQRNPKDQWARNGRATAYTRKGQPDRAIADYETLMQQQRDAGQAVDDALYINRAYAYLKKRDLDRALADFDRAIAIQASPRNYTQRANFHYREGQYAEAATDAEQALALDPLNAGAVDTLAHLMVVRGQPERALLLFERAMLLGGPGTIAQYQAALKGHGYDVGTGKHYGRGTIQALAACLRAGCRLVE